MWFQHTIRLAARPRGCHLVTADVVGQLPMLRGMKVGIAHLFISHTSAGLALCENADPDVRRDMSTWLDRAVPDGAEYFVHDAEGPDDMPAHVKSVLVGSSLTIPISGGRLALGTWQGIWLCEFRDAGGAREMVATLQGE